MKKLILMLFLVVGGIMNAGAAHKLFVCFDRQMTWWFTEANAKIFAWCVDESDDSHNANVELERKNFYGDVWFVYDLPDYITQVYVKRVNPANSSDLWGQTNPVSISGDTYIKVLNDGDWDKKTFETVSAPTWNYVVMRGNVITPGALWNNDEANTTKNGDVFTCTVTKSAIDKMSDDGISAGKIRFRFHHGDPVIFDDYGTKKNDGYASYPEIAPQVAGATSIPVATNMTEYYQDVNSGNYWEMDKPTYDYEKIVFTADYSTHKWVIRADAYISKTVSADNQYATIGAPVPLDLSVVAASNVTAYKLAANASTGVITKTEKTDALAANEGALLENKTGSNVVLSIPVAASAIADGSNQLKAFTDDGKLAQVSEAGYTNYILTKESEHVGFYKVNDAGNSMGANTAYLHVQDPVPNAGDARMAFFFDEGEATAIQNVEKMQAKGQFFNLNGQRVAQPQKGLYIVNGKKMLMK